MEIRHYPSSEEVKQVAIGVERYRARHVLDAHYYGQTFDEERFKLDEERFKLLTTDKLLDGLRQFVRCEVSDDLIHDYKAVECNIYMPYVYDEAMRNKDITIDLYLNEKIRLQQEVNKYEYHLKMFSKLPWYKRIWKAFKKSW